MKWSVYAWHGILPLGRRIIECPETLRPSEILGTHNVTVRRVMIDRFGMTRLLREVRAEQADCDSDQFGRPRRLWRVPPGLGTQLDFETSGEPVLLLSMMNSTPDSSGTHEEYLLRVPPTMTTCQEAMAWTWGMEGEAYAPTAEA